MTDTSSAQRTGEHDGRTEFRDTLSASRSLPGGHGFRVTSKRE